MIDTDSPNLAGKQSSGFYLNRAQGRFGENRFLEFMIQEVAREN